VTNEDYHYEAARENNWTETEHERLGPGIVDGRFEDGYSNN